MGVDREQDPTSLQRSSSSAPAAAADDGILQEDEDAELDEDSALQSLLASPHSRMVGGTEFSWCRAVSGGTGITILGLLLSRALDATFLQGAIDRLQCRHPRLRSGLVWVEGRPALSVSPVPIVKVQIVSAPAEVEDDRSAETEDNNGSEGIFSTAEGGMRDNGEPRDCAQEKPDLWLRLVEIELNTNDWPEQHHCLDPKPMFVVRLHNLPRARSLLLFRLHTAICDRTSAATILTELLQDFCSQSGLSIGNGANVVTGAAKEQSNVRTCEAAGERLLAVEDTIPKGQASKPFWAHGVDILGYSLGSRRHAALPFEDAEQARRSEIICHTLGVEHTQKLLQMCARQKTSRVGALSAAGLKATAVLKQLGSRSEHYAVVTLIDCRSVLDPILPASTVGFYHSAILNTHELSESSEFWELARRCSGALESAMRRRKQLTDMADVNFLMCQAMQFPQLTPAGSLRTSLMVVFEEAAVEEEEMEEAKRAVGVEEYVGCSSIHGVGPSIALFDSLVQQGSLRSTCVYPAPLHSRAQITAFLHTMMAILVSAAALHDHPQQQQQQP